MPVSNHTYASRLADRFLSFLGRHRHESPGCQRPCPVRGAMPVDHYFQVAGFSFRLLLPDGMDVDALLPSFRAFRSAGTAGQPVLFTLDTCGPLPVMGKGKLLEESVSDLGLTRLWRATCGYHMEVSRTASSPRHILCALADFSHVWAQMRWEDASAGSVLCSMLRMSVAQAILPYGALSVHAAAVVLDGAAYLFMGKSGTGKSTHARLWMRNFPDCQLLNDDNPVLRLRDDGRVWAYGSPWSGKTACYRPLAFPVRGIVRLYQAPVDRYVPCSDVDAFTALLPGCSAIHGRNSMYQLMTGTVSRVAMQVRVGLLECLPDDGAALLCARSLGATGTTKDTQTPIQV